MPGRGGCTLSHSRGGEHPLMLTLGGCGGGGAEPWGALAGGLVPPPLEKADHGQEEAAEDGAQAEAQRAVDQGPLVGAQPQPWGHCKTAGSPEFRGFPARTLLRSVPL